MQWSLQIAGIQNLSTWANSIIITLLKELSAEISQSTVLFGANIAYLAIPGILESHGEVTLGSVASLVSAILSLNSIILGLLLTKRFKYYGEMAASYQVCL